MANVSGFGSIRFSMSSLVLLLRRNIIAVSNVLRASTHPKIKRTVLNGERPKPRFDLPLHESGGLLKIVKNQCLWASDLNSVNDPAELLHIRAEFERVIGSAFQDGPEEAHWTGERVPLNFGLCHRLSNRWPGET